MTERLLLQALYENRKQFMLVSYRVHKELSGYSEPYIYAIANDLCPFFHQDGEATDPYIDCYKIKEEWAISVVEFVDEKWLNEAPFSFYDLEKQFGGRGDRWKLICVLRYCFLDERFNEKFWNSIGSEAPSEAKLISRELSSWEI